MFGRAGAKYEALSEQAEEDGGGDEATANGVPSGPPIEQSSGSPDQTALSVAGREVVGIAPASGGDEQRVDGEEDARLSEPARPVESGYPPPATGPPGSFGDIHWGVGRRETPESFGATAEEADDDNQARDQAGDDFLEELRTADDARAVEMVQNANAALLNTTDSMDCMRALLILAAEGRLEACKVVLARDDFNGVNTCDVIGSNALHLAAGNDQAEVCQTLLDCPRFLAGVNAQNFHMRTPLDFASDFGDEERVKEVLKAAGGISAGGGRRNARQSGRYQVGDQGTLERLPSDDEKEVGLPALEELQGEEGADMAELD